MKAIERLIQYIDYKGFSNRSFEIQIGLSNGYIGTQLKRNADLGESILNKILDNCLDINPIWLISGKGEMLKQKEAPIVPIVNEKDSYIIELQKDKIRSLEKELQNQRQEIEQLKKELSSVPVVKRGDNYI